MRCNGDGYEKWMRGIESGYDNNELKIGGKNNEEKSQYRVGNDDSQENAYCRNDLLPA